MAKAKKAAAKKAIKKAVARKAVIPARITIGNLMKAPCMQRDKHAHA